MIRGRKTLIDYFPDASSSGGSIFGVMNWTPWYEVSDAQSLALDYFYNHSGLKLPSGLVRQMSGNEHVIDAEAESLISSLLRTKYQYKWEALWKQQALLAGVPDSDYRELYTKTGTESVQTEFGKSVSHRGDTNETVTYGKAVSSVEADISVTDSERSSASSGTDNTRTEYATTETEKIDESVLSQKELDAELSREDIEDSSHTLGTEHSERTSESSEESGQQIKVSRQRDSEDSRTLSDKTESKSESGNADRGTVSGETSETSETKHESLSKQTSATSESEIEKSATSETHDEESKSETDSSASSEVSNREAKTSSEESKSGTGSSASSEVSNRTSKTSSEESKYGTDNSATESAETKQTSETSATTSKKDSDTETDDDLTKKGSESTAMSGTDAVTDSSGQTPRTVTRDYSGGWSDSNTTALTKSGTETVTETGGHRTNIFGFDTQSQDGVRQSVVAPLENTGTATTFTNRADTNSGAITRLYSNYRETETTTGQLTNSTLYGKTETLSFTGRSDERDIHTVYGEDSSEDVSRAGVEEKSASSSTASETDERKTAVTAENDVADKDVESRSESDERKTAAAVENDVAGKDIESQSESFGFTDKHGHETSLAGETSSGVTSGSEVGSTESNGQSSSEKNSEIHEYSVDNRTGAISETSSSSLAGEKSVDLDEQLDTGASSSKFNENFHSIDESGSDEKNVASSEVRAERSADTSSRDVRSDIESGGSDTGTREYGTETSDAGTISQRSDKTKTDTQSGSDVTSGHVDKVDSEGGVETVIRTPMLTEERVGRKRSLAEMFIETMSAFDLGNFFDVVFSDMDEVLTLRVWA